MTNKNAFGEYIPSIREILSESTIRDYIEHALAQVLGQLEAKSPRVTSCKIINIVKTKQGTSPRHEQEIYEKLAKQKLDDAGVTDEKIKAALCGRAELVYRQIRPCLAGNTILDFGCGDGRIGERLSQEGFLVDLADVYKNPHVEKTGLEFIPINGDSNANKKYHNVLLLTVMHHSNDPLKTLDDAISKTRDGGRIIAIESVYGTDKKAQEPTWNSLSRELTDRFKGLSKEQQFKANIFFDHFYNRIVHYTSNTVKKINVPFNFRQPTRLIEPRELLEEGWENIAYNKGLKPIHFEYLGIDQPVVPEYHTLHVWEKP